MSAASVRATGIGFVLRNRIAFVCAFVLFIVLAGTGTAAALWQTSASLTASAGVATVADNSCVGSTFITNGSFETPPVTGVTTRAMSPWVTTDTAGIEVWPDETFSVDSILGNQFIELNASRAATVSQTITTTPGQTLQWSLVHRGREGADTMEVLIGASVAAGVSQRTITDGVGAWVRYSGAYTVPANQGSTTFSMKSVSTYNNQASIGNLIDGVSFGTGPCLSSVSTVRNTNNNGAAVRPGDILEYTTSIKNNGGTPAITTVFSDVLSASLTPVTGSLATTGGGSATLTAPRTLTARLGLGATATVGGIIDPGITATFTFRATVAPGTGGTTIDYSPEVSYSDRLAPAWMLSAAPPALSTPVLAGADIVATVNGPAYAAPGKTVTYQFVLANASAVAATGVTFTGTLPRTFTMSGNFTRTGSMPEPNCSVVTNSTTVVYTCTVGNYAANATGSLSVNGTFTGNNNTVLTTTMTAASTSNDPNTGNNTSSLTTTLDTNVPGNVTQNAATATSANQTTLNWTAASDNYIVASYNIYGPTGDTVIATSTSTSFTVTGLTPGGTTSYRIKAVDGAGNVSNNFSSTVTVTTPLAALPPASIYSIVNPNAFCVDADASGQAAGTKLIQYTCNNGMNQRWQFVATSDGYYTIHPQYTTAISWGVVSASNADYAKVELSATNANATTQQWMPVPVSNGRVKFVNRSSSRCLDVPNNIADSGAWLQQYSCNDTTAQYFALTAVN